MKILLSEHISTKLFPTVKNPQLEVHYLDEQEYQTLNTKKRRPFAKDIYPYSLTLNSSENCFDIKADYYVGLDWLVKGVKYIQVEPKINKKLLEIYEESINKEIETSEKAEQEDKEKQNEIEQSLKTDSNAAQINYLKMLLDVYSSSIPHEDIGNLVEIYWDDEKIKIEQKDDHLTPFLVVQFLGFLKTIVRKGLKKSYYKVKENLNNRVKGKILVGEHIKQNVFKNRLTSTYCEYQVFGENNHENQFLKKVYQFCSSYIQNNSKFYEEKKGDLENLINYISPAFQHVGDFGKDNRLKHFKYNPFFKEYKEAIQIGNLILRQFGFNISSTTKTEIETPPFWIDMPRLFELYFYQKLLKANPNLEKKIEYQFATHGNSLDFLIKDGENSIIIDTKYKLQYQHGQIHEDIRQVSGYARLKRVRGECGINDDSHINCLIIYPRLLKEEEEKEMFTLESLQNLLNESNEIKAYHKVYKLGIELPII